MSGDTPSEHLLLIGEFGGVRSRSPSFVHTILVVNRWLALTIKLTVVSASGVQSGKHLLTLSFSGFDPMRKSAPRNGASGRVQFRPSTLCQISDIPSEGWRTPGGSIERFEAT